MAQTREFSNGDVRGVTEVVTRTLGESYPPSLYLTVHNIWPEGFLVVEEAGMIVAFSATVLTSTTSARILMLGVLPEFRQRSIGHGLMAETYTRCLARGIDTVTLEVRKSNAAALTFYEREGFSICGEMKNFYSNGEDAHKMIKVLTS